MISGQPTIAEMRSWRRAILAVLVLTAFSGSAWANCTGDEPSDTSRMVCCAGGHDQCPMHDAKATCCKLSVTPAPSQATLAKITSVSAPDYRSIDFVVVVAVLESTNVGRHSAASSSPPNRIQPPPYIAFSALLI